MERLIRAGLRYGGLLHIDDPHLIGRYNRALEAFGLRPTMLPDFYIDASGYSVEVGLELGDEAYLDPLGVNRRFIILSPDQYDLPLLRTSFSADGQIWRAFFKENRPVIQAATLRDALYGEIENLVFDVRDPGDVLAIRTVSFNVRTPSGLIERAAELERQIARFRTEPMVWRNEALMQTIVAGAREVGDVRRNGFALAKTDFAWPRSFWTAHFGGAYVFATDSGPVLVGDPDVLKPVPPGASVVAVHETPVLFSLLGDNALMAPFDGSWLIDSGILAHRLRLLVAELLARGGSEFDLSLLKDDAGLSRAITGNMARLGADQRFRAISEMRALLASGGNAEGFEQHLPAEQRFMFRRALPDIEGAGDVNRLIVEHLPFDTLSTFILDKRRFYEIYDSFDDRLRAFTVDYITQHYAPAGSDRWRIRAKVRETLFGLH
ncbi:MAG: hypothetical protein KDI98_09045 [Hyphomicrobiaceae bacterium]|nr:hypothetical protein [Hyphomicrobiaceae bacterium]